MAQKRSSIELYKFKKLLNELASKEGKGTELVSIYVPPDRSISDVINYLRQEYATAANIKSKTTRKNVQDAIERAIQRLKLFSDAKPNGIAVFSGAIPQNGPGTEKVEVYHVIPPEPINTFLYSCDSRFRLEPLLEQLKEKDVYGIIVIDNEEAAIAVVKGKRLEVSKTFTSGVPGKHRAGGQSARRFERLREQNLNEYYKRIADHANEIFLAYPEIRAIILAGPGPTKEAFLKTGYLHYTFRDKIHVVDTSYSGESGIREAITKASEQLKESRLVEEKQLIQRLMGEVVSQNGKAIYGEQAVRNALRSGMLEMLLISEDLDRVEVRIECSNCGYTKLETLNDDEVQVTLPNILSQKCPSCSNQTLQAKKIVPLIDVLIDEAEESGTDVELISGGHEEGEMFKKAFSGLAGFLKGRAGT
ncbi:MAG: peptide chain release factor aRF-1 [Nitrososphaerota archaeon]|nr:peptide chain release factor aRF-1 [Aigarchaeota archaeon]MDW8076642.1 peptide chain release factor aRF-1 [Nitrososphaerota archaeon]